jgi:RimJ/RimL family protein N-acetyltransferase
MTHGRAGTATSLPPVVTTGRLRLPLVTPDEAAGMREGRRGPEWHPDYPRPDDLDAVSMIRADAAPDVLTWGPRHIVRAVDGLVCGSIGFFGPPEPAADGVPEAEVGYGLVAEARGHGAATEALRGLLRETDHVGTRVRASVAPDHRASVRVLAKCGFTELRGSDEEGNLVMARPVNRPEDRPGE